MRIQGRKLVVTAEDAASAAKAQSEAALTPPETQ